MKKIDGILFDLDGTLWEVSDITYESANEIAEKYNLPKIEKSTISSCMGLNALDTARKYLPTINNEEKLLDILNEISENNVRILNKKGGNVYFNLDKTLEILKEKYKIGIVSNTLHEEYIEAFMNSSDLKTYFDDYMASGKKNMTKAKAIRMMMEKNNLKNVVYVGDTKKDMEAANDADVIFIHAKYGFGEELETRFTINDIYELPELIEEINNEI